MPADPAETEVPVRITHLALRVADVERTAGFYRRYCGWRVVKRRETSGDKAPILWVGPEPETGEELPDLVLVLLEWPVEEAEKPPVDHLGMAVESREEVERIAALAESEDRLVYGPETVDQVAGYLCTVRDPEGRSVEFSYGQPLDED